MKPYPIEFTPQQLQIVVAHLAQGQYAQVSTVIDSIKQQATAEDGRRLEAAKAAAEAKTNAQVSEDAAVGC